MDSIDSVDAANLVRRIEDQTSRFAAGQALALRDKWIYENDLGTLQMSKEIRAILGKAQVP